MSRSIDELAEQLEDGYRRIDVTQRRGEDVLVWEEFWLKLLREYDLLCEELEHDVEMNHERKCMREKRTS